MITNSQLLVFVLKLCVWYCRGSLQISSMSVVDEAAMIVNDMLHVFPSGFPPTSLCFQLLELRVVHG